MGSPSCAIVLLCVQVWFCIAAINTTNTLEVHQKHLQEQTTPSRYSRRRSSSDYSFVPTNALTSLQLSEQIASLPEFTDFGKKEVHENVKTIIVTKKVPVPYTVHVEKKVPYPVRVPIRRPFTVYVPKPYLLELTKPYPLAIKVPVPQPYAVEKHVPFPVKIPVEKPIPIHIAKPYPVIVEKKIPFPVEKHIPVEIKIPYDRPVPVHIPIERPFHYPVERPIPISFRLPSLEHRPIGTHMETTVYTQPSEHVLEKPQAANSGAQADSLHMNNLVSSNMERTPAQQTVASNFYPSSYDPYHSSLLPHSSNQLTSSPSNSMESYSLGTIHVPETHSYNWSTSYTDWVPKQRYSYKKSENSVPKTMNTYRIVLPDRLVNTLNSDTMAAYNQSPTLKETHGIHYEPVRYDAFKQDGVKMSLKNSQIQQHLQQEQLQQLQETMNNYHMKSLLKYNQASSKPLVQSYRQFYNIHPQSGGGTSQQESSQHETSSASSSKVEIHPVNTKWIAHSDNYSKNQKQPASQQSSQTQQHKNRYEDVAEYTYEVVQPNITSKKPHYHMEEVAFAPSPQALYMEQPSYSAPMVQSFSKHEASQHMPPEKLQLYSKNHRWQYQREEYEQPQYNEPAVYGQAIEYHYAPNLMNALSVPHTNSHAGIILPTATSQQTIPATSQPLQPTAPTQQLSNITEATKKNDHIMSIQNPILNTPISLPITFNDVQKHLIRKIRRKNSAKRKSLDRQVVQQ